MNEQVILGGHTRAFARRLLQRREAHAVGGRRWQPYTLRVARALVADRQRGMLAHPPSLIAPWRGAALQERAVLEEELLLHAPAALSGGLPIEELPLAEEIGRSTGEPSLPLPETSVEPPRVAPSLAAVRAALSQKAPTTRTTPPALPTPVGRPSTARPPGTRRAQEAPSQRRPEAPISEQPGTAPGATTPTGVLRSVRLEETPPAPTVRSQEPPAMQYLTAPSVELVRAAPESAVEPAAIPSAEESIPQGAAGEVSAREIAPGETPPTIRRAPMSSPPMPVTARSAEPDQSQGAQPPEDTPSRQERAPVATEASSGAPPHDESRFEEAVSPPVSIRSAEKPIMRTEAAPRATQSSIGPADAQTLADEALPPIARAEAFTALPPTYERASTPRLQPTATEPPTARAREPAASPQQSEQATALAAAAMETPSEARQAPSTSTDGRAAEPPIRRLPQEPAPVAQVHAARPTIGEQAATAPTAEGERPSVPSAQEASSGSLPWQARPLHEALFGAHPSEGAPAEEQAAPSFEEQATAEIPTQARPLHEALFDTTGEERPSLASPQEPLAIARGIIRRAPGVQAAPVMAPYTLPVAQVNLVRRVEQASAAPQTARPAEPGAGATETAPAPGAEASAQPNLDRLAEEVYRRLRERLRVERERYGPSHRY